MKGARPISGAVLAFALVVGLVSLEHWLRPGTVPGARGWFAIWPLTALASAAILAAAGALRRAPLGAWALGALAWAFAVRAASELNAFATSLHVNDGPALVPVYLAIGLATGLYGIAGWRDHSLAERGCVLLALWSTSNLRLFSRRGELAFHLFAAGVLLCFCLCERRWTLRGLLRGSRRWPTLVVLAFLAWLALAAILGDSLARGSAIWLRCATGGLLAWTLAGSLERRGVGRVYGGLLAGLALSVVLLAVGLCETAQHVQLERLAITRLRLFGQHANGTGPLLAIGLCLSLAPLLFVRLGLAARLGALLLALILALALWRTESAASQVGAALGLGSLVWMRWGRLPHRPLAPTALLLGLALVAGILFLSPVGEGARAWLDAKAQTQSAIGQRWHFWGMALAAVSSSPLWGVGPNQYHLHARYAEPSYYDGTAQDLHPHNLFLALAEGTGWIGLALFAALLLAVLELARRGLLMAGLDAGQRAVAAGIGAALLALMGCNLLDLGQSQTTFVPLLLWLALGLLAALVATPLAELTDGHEPAARPRVMLSALALLPLALGPAAGSLTSERGEARFATGVSLADLEAGAAWHELALKLNPLEHWPHQRIARTYGQYGEQMLARGDREEWRRAGALAEGHLETVCARVPGRSAAWLRLTRNQLDMGRAAEALASLERAVELDPRGQRWGDHAFFRAWALLLLGELEPAREALLLGFARGSNLWRSLPQLPLPARPEDLPGARRIAFRTVGPGERRRIPLTELLEELSERALAQVAEDPIGARRLVGQLVEIHLAQGLPQLALQTLDRYAALAPRRMVSIDLLYVRTLAALGELERAIEVALANTDASDPYLHAALVNALLESGDPEYRARALELTGSLDSLQPGDIFFEAGQDVWILDLAVRVALERGEIERALALHRESLYEHSDIGQRVGSCDRLLELLVSAETGDEVLAEVLGRLIHSASLSRTTAGDVAAMQRRARRVRDAWQGDPARIADGLGDCGSAGGTFLEALGELSPADQ